MTDNTVKLPEPAFRLKWRDSYLVDKPNIGDTDCYTAAQLTAAVMDARSSCDRCERAERWRPIETAPEGRLVVVGWKDDEDTETPDRQEFDFKVDGVWQHHADWFEHANLVAPPGSRMPSENALYKWWMDLPPLPQPPTEDDNVHEQD